MMYRIRPIQASDNTQIAQIIRTVSSEYGLATESGFAVADPILDNLYAVYSQPHAQYWVIENDQGQLFGGGGLSVLQGESHILEIQKMYFLPEIRGLVLQKFLNKPSNLVNSMTIKHVI